MQNDLSFLCYMVNRLRTAGIKCIVFGGWAEELTKVISPKPHSDVDLLYIDDNFDRVDEFFRNQSDLEEITAKHFSHKRAFMCRGIMVEILLVRRLGNRLITVFWDEHELKWPDMSTVFISSPTGVKLEVSEPGTTFYYRQHQKQIASIRAKYVPDH